MVPKRVCIKKAELNNRGYQDFLDWKSDPEHLYIGRNMAFYVPGATASEWANPFVLKKYTREDSLALYRTWLGQELNSDLVNRLHVLRNYKEIGCWCLPNEKCHGDVLIEMLNK